MEFKKTKSLKGTVTIPGDKSISHRAIMLGSLAHGMTEITNFLQSADCLSTMNCFKKMGVDITNTKDTVLIKGKGLHGLTKPDTILDVGNSGTTIRIMSGILSGQNFGVTITGDKSIRKRPMKRIIDPLSQMGANISSLEDTGCAPLHIEGTSIHGIHYRSKVASAQVKSSILLAGLYANDYTSITEPYLSRNHTELMIRSFGGMVETLATTTTISPKPSLKGQKIPVPGDISSAAYFIAAGLLVPNSEILIETVGINPTRDGLIRVCKDMGGDITLSNIRTYNGEKVADILVRTSNLKGTIVEGSLIPTLIDELPVVALLACFADGKTIIKDAAELKVKESNRIEIMVDNLSTMNAQIEATDDGMIITGGHSLSGALIDSKSDHRIAMTFAIAGLLAHGTTKIKGFDCVKISYPNFHQDLIKLIQ